MLSAGRPADQDSGFARLAIEGKGFEKSEILHLRIIMMKKPFLCLFMLLCSISSLFAFTAACLNSSIADLWSLAGGSVDITVQDSIDRGFASPDAILVDSASGRNINTEILISSHPDLVLGSTDTASHVRLKSFLDEKGISMILIKQDSFEDFLAVFRTLTSITGRDDLSMLYGTRQEEGIDEIIAQCGEIEEKPRVLFVRAGSAFSSVRAKRADDHFAAGIIEDLGGINVADETGILTESLSLEAMITGNIDKILIVPKGEEDESIRYITSLFSRPGWRDVKAVREGEVHFLSKDLFHYKPNGRWEESYRVMAEVLYGE